MSANHLPVDLLDVGAAMAARHLDHHAAISPLGWWLLAALIGTPHGLGGSDDELGMPGAEASALARQALAHPHPGLARAVAVWTGTGSEPDAAARLADVAGTGPIPTQAQADAWAREHTDGLIEQFPVAVDPGLAILLASALSVRADWDDPFESADAFTGEFASATVLGTPETGHRIEVVDTVAAGLVGVHAATAPGLTVWSVIAATGIGPESTHRAAVEVVRLAGGLSGSARRIPRSELSRGEGHAWTVSKPRGRSPRDRARLPQWSAATTVDLGAEPVLALLGPALDRLLVPAARPARVSATQTTVAAFHAAGFDAASISAVWLRSGAPRDGTAELALRFDRPYAVLAIAEDLPVLLPAFCAWVADVTPR